MEFLADLHIHSRFSRATSRDCTPSTLDLWARRKGIALLGTGDFTHRAWRKELEEMLTPDGSGLYTLKKEFRSEEAAPAGETGFIVSGEISCIYKKNGRTRKVHNVILLPGLDAAEKLSLRLEAIGNLHSDGRPILGLDSKTLLAMTLDACPEAIFIPAHIWTPHFSVLGANSGFDAIEECYEDLTSSIYAVETGLSSDPPMNWRLSQLDRFALVSNSDAHSPSKIAREANLFDTDCTYAALHAALKNNDHGAFRGTVEFFPEEGKYHLDGHRACNVRFEPLQTIAANGRCPVCGGKLTVGVLHRVEVLADRAENSVAKGPNVREFIRMTTLPHIIAASFGCGSCTRRVDDCYGRMLGELGPELDILRKVSLDDITRVAGGLIAEGVRRTRQGDLAIRAGYDGEYGVIEIFSDAQRREFLGQAALFETAPVVKKKQPRSPLPQENGEWPGKKGDHCPQFDPKTIALGLNGPQLRAVNASEGPVMVIAGPGTGKTRTLVSRIATLVTHQGVSPAAITAVTFTNKAAQEMRIRLAQLLPGDLSSALTVGTFHGICLELLRTGRQKEDCGETRRGPAVVDEAGRTAVMREILSEAGSDASAARLLREISFAKSRVTPAAKTLDALTLPLFRAYEKRLASLGALDFDDLLLRALHADEQEEACGAASNGRFSHLLIDEFQDINEVQYALVKKWSRRTGNVFVIGDPHQAIYGFRGASPEFFERFIEDFPEADPISLGINYRSSVAIVNSAASVIAPLGATKITQETINAHSNDKRPIRVVLCRTVRAEAAFIAEEINRMVGGTDMIDAHRFGNRAQEGGTRGFSDMAVLYRTHRQGAIIERALVRAGIACRIAGRDEALGAPQVSAVLAFIRFAINPDDVFSLITALEWCKAPPLIADLFAASQMRTPEELLATVDKSPAALASIGCEVFCKAVRSANDSVNSGAAPCECARALCSALSLEIDEPLERLLSIADLCADCRALINAVTLGEEADIVRSNGKRRRADAVLLSTLHASKGLEFPVVFICGATDGLLPLRDAEGVCADPDEERRLFYVGMTRAREELVITVAKERRIRGEESAQCEPSPFLADMDEKHVLHETFCPQPVVEQMSLL